MRVLHASPNAPAVDVFVDNVLSIANLAFGQVSDYLALAPGGHVLRVFPSGAGSQGQEILNAQLRDLQAGQDYTAIVVGMLEHIHAILLHDSTPEPAAGHAKVRAVHASPDVPPVDVALAGRPAVFRNLVFRHATPFQEVESGTVDVEIRPSGQTETVMVLPDFSLAGGNLYTFVALGLLQGQPAFMVMPLIEAVELRQPL